MHSLRMRKNLIRLREVSGVVKMASTWHPVSTLSRDNGRNVAAKIKSITSMTADVLRRRDIVPFLSQHSIKFGQGQHLLLLMTGTIGNSTVACTWHLLLQFPRRWDTSAVNLHTLVLAGNQDIRRPV